ncbi:hypothetical protein [Spirosoma fluviale]|uniref:Uncharacterized protein n=1 Tax=Spirosoma fluviale TaxID=1597977 RepID=A0A286GAW6_9BACT|nr:hypothetical protein [Spirosoma fluviale]SOD92665.1 hypothetical protein SAMN06269250_4096 [Spirosoma fluviale]
MDDVFNYESIQMIGADAPKHVDVQTDGTIIRTSVPDDKVKQVIVTIHGVGDQHTFATLQSVVNQFCQVFGETTAIPLGSFHTGHSTFSVQPPYPAKRFEHMAFAEVYGAKVPRDVVTDQYTLEEAKRWANTIVERLRLRWKQEKDKDSGKDCKTHCNEADFTLLKLIFREMIQTIAVLERLCFLAEKAGLFTFDLGKLLNDYLGDVQLVAEFSIQRQKILDTFSSVMKSVHETYPKSDIHLVAHSEGTVIAFLGLLQALREPTSSPWINNVRGFMTLGSPLDKHMILWPELFESKMPAPKITLSKKIEWRNYYDRGDPIGFELNDTRDWLNHRGFEHLFNFKEEHDFGFIRYPFPGKAHVDYWDDNAVFGHFIESVINKPDASKSSNTSDGILSKFSKPPKDIKWTKWLSRILPYLGIGLILFTVDYFLIRAVFEYIDPKRTHYGSRGERFIFYNVLGATLLLYGVTVTSRIPRLTRINMWRVGALGIYFFCAMLFLFVVPEDDLPQKKLKYILDNALGFITPTGSVHVIAITTMVTIVYYVSKKWPSTGVIPLIVLGTLTIVGMIYGHIESYESIDDESVIWPLLITAAGFLYVWWLTALLFDLVFIWHIYIGQSVALKRMDEVIRSTARKETSTVT